MILNVLGSGLNQMLMHESDDKDHQNRIRQLIVF